MRHRPRKVPTKRARLPHAQQPTDMEHRIAEFLLAGEMDPFPTLREQWKRVRILRRHHSDDGLAVDLQVPLSAPCASLWRYDISDVQVLFDDGSSGYAALFVNGGMLVQLWITNWTPPWRPELGLGTLFYSRMIEPATEDGQAEFIRIEQRDWPAVAAEIREAKAWPINQ